MARSTMTVQELYNTMKDLIYAGRANDPVYVFDEGGTGNRVKISTVDVDMTDIIDLNVDLEDTI